MFTKYRKFDEMEPGEFRTYHVGFLLRDRNFSPALSRRADDLWRRQGLGEARLFQVREGDHCTYLVQRV